MDESNQTFGFDCTAFMLVKQQQSGRLLVNACLSHFGHSNERKWSRVWNPEEVTWRKRREEERLVDAE